MTRLYTPSIVALMLGGAAVAQTSAELEARNFHFDNYRTVIRLDMQAIRDTGVWDELLAGGAKVISQLTREQFGFDLDALDRLCLTRRAVEGRDVSDQVLVMEYNADVGVPPAYDSARYRVSVVGPYELYVDSRATKSMVMPSARMVVVGAEQRLRDILGGEPRAGLPSADVMSLTAGKQGTLAEFVIDLEQEAWLMKDIRDALRQLNVGVEWPKGDEPQLMSGRVSVVGDEDDPRLELAVVLRHAAAADGVEVTARTAAAGIAALKKVPAARLFWPLLKEVVYERSVTDGIWRVDLGRARAFGGVAAVATPLVIVWLTLRDLVPGIEARLVPGADREAGGGR